MSDDAERIIRHLDLRPHPEGGWFRETFRDGGTVNGRACSSAIYFLLKAGEASHWHRVDAVETWHFYRGAPLRLSLAEDGGAAAHHGWGPISWRVSIRRSWCRRACGRQQEASAPIRWWAAR